MSDLVGAYVEGLSSAGRTATVSGDLEERLSRLWSRGIEAHPGAGIAAATFVRHLALCSADVSDSSETMHAEDLFLSCAALAGDRLAIETLRRIHQPVIASYLGRIDRVSGRADDIDHQLWETLLVGSADQPPKLLTYSGRGQLAGFVGICALRLATTLFRRAAAEERALANARAEAVVVGDDPELSIIKQRYRHEFEQAVMEAMTVLDDRERLMLRMLVINGQSLERIAAVYGINQSSVSRRLAKARQRVLAQARLLLHERLKISEAEFDSLANLVLSQVDLSVSNLLENAS